MFYTLIPITGCQSEDKYGSKRRTCSISRHESYRVLGTQEPVMWQRVGMCVPSKNTQTDYLLTSVSILYTNCYLVRLLFSCLPPRS